MRLLERKSQGCEAFREEVSRLPLTINIKNYIYSSIYSIICHSSGVCL
jgi:hypothetical protein